MHTLTLKVHDNIYHHILYLLKSMDKKEVEIVLDTHIKSSKNVNQQIKALLQEQKHPLFQSIDDPVKWQQKLREEW